MNSTIGQLILAAVVLALIGGLVYVSLYYAQQKGADDASKVNDAAMADANNEVSANLGVDDTADQLSAATY